MATAQAIRKQDLPPEGGYKKIPYIRNPARTYFKGWQIFGAYFGISAAGFYVYYLTCKDIKQQEIEMRSAKHALYPFLLAERDREYMKQLRRNRDEEAALMANVPGWKVGTWYGEPIYKLKDPEQWVDPSFKEFYAHNDNKSIYKRVNLKMWS